MKHTKPHFFPQVAQGALFPRSSSSFAGFTCNFNENMSKFPGCSAGSPDAWYWYHASCTPGIWSGICFACCSVNLTFHSKLDTNVYKLANDTTADQASDTQDTVLAVLVGCVLAFYIISIFVVGCTRHSLRMQVTAPVEAKRRVRTGNGAGAHELDIAAVLSSKSGTTNVEMKSTELETAETSEVSTIRPAKELL